MNFMYGARWCCYDHNGGGHQQAAAAAAVTPTSKTNEQKKIQKTNDNNSQFSRMNILDNVNNLFCAYELSGMRYTRQCSHAECTPQFVYGLPM